MEEEPSDPHEKQLFVVFKSCLALDQTELDKDGLLKLCTKLELEQDHKETILKQLKINSDHKSVSFSEFRDEFLSLLDKSQESSTSEKEINGESQALSKSITMCSRFSHPNEQRKQSGAMDCKQTDIDQLQRLQETWSNHNSFTIEDFNCILNKGLTLPKQTIELIFEKLDIDSDGLINLDEFLHFFQSITNKIHDQSSLNWSTQESNIKLECCKDFIHNQTSNVPRTALIELWELAGVSEPNSLLLDLGFDGPTVSLINLSNALSSELKVHRDVSHTGRVGEYVRLLRGALILYQEEVRNLNLSIEHLSGERDKLRTDLNEANERSNVLAQEVDEHQVRIDKTRQEQVRQLELKHSEAMKNLTEQLQLEREKSTVTLSSLEEQLQKSQQEEYRIKTELTAVLEELKSLEKENLSQKDEIVDLKTSCSKMSKRVQDLVAAQDQVESIETKENEQVSDLMSHITRLQAEMKILRDHNDELTSELEMLKNRDNDAKSVVSSVEVRSTISDENDGLTSIPTTEVSDTEDEDKTHSRSSKSKIHARLDEGNTLNKLSEIIQEFRNFLTSAKFCAECTALRNEVSSLISELELYQSSVPSVQVTADKSSGGGKRKKPLKNLANELEAENEENSSESYLNWKKRTSNSDDRINDLEDNYGSFDFKSFQNKFSGLKDYPLRKEIKNNDELSNNNLELDQRNGEDDDFNEEETKSAAEKKKLLERCMDLEESLRLLRVEYEQCEDYWASKLDEERQIYEQEQKISDDKFSELIAKMAEYEEQFNPSDKVDGRLSPIEEKVNLEQQYNDLEDEFERWKIEAQRELSKKEQEIEELKKKLRNDNSMTDMSVQFPDEQLKTMYPELYSHLCIPMNSSVDNSSVRSEATIPTESIPQPCHQCHKIPSNCECHRSSQQQQPLLNQAQHRSRRSEGRNRNHHQYYPKKSEVDFEISSLIKQREKLKQEIIKLQSLKINPNIYPTVGAEDQNIHHNILSNLYSKLYNQDQKIKYMQIYCQTQQREHERILQGMWKSYIVENNDLRIIVKTTEDKLNHQIKINKEQKEKLTKADFLSKELYVENAKLAETIKRLEQHCQILSQNRIDSTSSQ